MERVYCITTNMAFDLGTLLMMVIVAVASGLTGIFALMRRMTLAADSLSHVALPGLGLAILFGIHPLIGGGAALLMGAFFVWSLERRTAISAEAIIGVLFSASLALGVLLSTEEELFDRLFGGVSNMGIWGIVFGVFGALLVILFILRFKERLLLAIVSEDLARVTGIAVSRMQLYFLLVFSLTVLLGLQFLGVLLMGSLIIIPAATARNLGWSLTSSLAISSGIAVFSVLLGYAIALQYHLLLGPIVILVAVAVFLLSLLLQRR